MKVDEILRGKGTKVYAVAANDPVADAVAMLNAHNIGALVVTGRDGELVGILSERDIIRRLNMADFSFFARPIRDCMTPDPITCSPGTDLDEVMQLMTNRRIRHLPVVEDAKLVGMISIGDVVKRKIELAEQEAMALREYIAS